MKCRICEKTFRTQRGLACHIWQAHQIPNKEYYDLYLKKPGEGICLECRQPTKYHRFSSGYARFCSQKCVGKSKEVKNQKIQTSLKNFGVDNPSKSIKVKLLKEDTCLENFGVRNPGQSKEIQERMKNTTRQKFGVDYYWQTEKHIEWMTNGGAAHANSFIKNPSKPQAELFELCIKLFPDAILNFPCLNYSIDIAIPNLCVAIEYDGSYWHQDTTKDETRQQNIEREGWKFVRYIDYVPTKQQLQEDVSQIIS